MLNLPQRIEQASTRGGSVTFIHGDEATTVPWSEVHQDAREVAAGLQARGLGRGSHVALLGPTSRPLVTAIQGVWLAGATLVVLPLPMRMGSIEEFVAQTRARIAAADVNLVLIDAQLAPFIAAEPTDPPMVDLDDVAGDAAAFTAPKVALDDLAILQFTSGSTSEPKGVMLQHRNVGANLDGMIAAVGFEPEHDVMVSWLPLYHDMGLVGTLTVPMTTGARLVLAGPQDFTASPGRWMQWMSDYHGTVTAGPNFSYALAARALRRQEGLDLSPARLVLNGAEPVDADNVEAFVAEAAKHGMRPGAIFPAFGMAELAIAGTFPEILAGLRTDDVDLRVLETERYAAPADPAADGTKRLARLGRPVPGLEIRIVDPENGRVRAEREVGELQIRGTSVMVGYYGRADATAEAFDGEWFRTGDLGYLLDGELVLCGRIKDVIIVAGRNVYPDDVERVVAGIEGVRPGNVIAFGLTGGRHEDLVIVAEAKEVDVEAVRREVSRRVSQSIGLRPKDVIFVTPGSLPKTSSGKLQRSLCRDRYLEQELQPV